MDPSPAPLPLISALRSSLSATETFIENGSKFLVAMLATLVHAVFYFVPNRFPLFEAVRLPLTPIDLAVPLVPATAWVYWTDYLLVFAAFSLRSGPGEAVRFTRIFLFTVVVSTLTHLLLPIEYPRELFPVPEGTGPLAAAALGTLRSFDDSRSCLPSLHVALATIAALSVTGASRWNLLLKAWAITVALSTLTTKQHYVYDVVAGLIVGALAHALFAPKTRSMFHGPPRHLAALHGGRSGAAGAPTRQPVGAFSSTRQGEAR